MTDIDINASRRHSRRWERRAKKYYRELLTIRDSLDKLADHIDHLLEEMDTHK